jgi:hypothetical protein
VPPWKVVAAKGLIGGLVCVAPILVSAMIALLIAGDRELSWAELVGMYAMALGVTLAMHSWLTAAAIRQPSEARAALVGIAVVVGWFLLVAMAEMPRTEMLSVSEFEQWVGACSPLGFIIIKEDHVPRLVVIGLQLLSMALLWTWSAKRIGKSGKVVA